MDLWKFTNGSPMPPSTVMSLATEILLKRGDAGGVSAQWYRLFSQRHLKREKVGIAPPSRAPSNFSRRLTGEEEESLLKAIHEWEAASGTIIPTPTIRSLVTEMLIAKGDPKPLGTHWFSFFLARHTDYKEARYARLRNEKHARPPRGSNPQRKLPRKLTIEEEEALAKTIEAWETERDSPMTMAAIAGAAGKILLARESRIQAAVDALRNNQVPDRRRAAELFGLSYSTVYRYAAQEKGGRPPRVIHPEDEAFLVQALRDSLAAGDSLPSIPDIKRRVEDMGRARGLEPLVSSKWCLDLLGKYPDLKEARRVQWLQQSGVPENHHRTSRALSPEEEDSLVKAIDEWDTTRKSMMPSAAIRNLVNDMLVAKGDYTPVGNAWHPKLKQRREAEKSQVRAPKKPKPTPTTRLSAEDLTRIVKAIDHWETTRGSRMPTTAIIDFASQLAAANGRKIPFSTKWYYSFMKRRPDLRQRRATRQLEWKARDEEQQKREEEEQKKEEEEQKKEEEEQKKEEEEQKKEEEEQKKEEEEQKKEEEEQKVEARPAA
ncbi:hypothetical protein N0V88_001710 [Collariella sp. IMI 366227]|nr:hypothetical protein N0V88_001710 [Collariella sp. IMI 366227]